MRTDTLEYMRGMAAELAKLADANNAPLLGCIFRIAERAADEMLAVSHQAAA